MEGGMEGGREGREGGRACDWQGAGVRIAE